MGYCTLVHSACVRECVARVGGCNVFQPPAIVFLVLRALCVLARVAECAVV